MDDFGDWWENISFERYPRKSFVFLFEIRISNFLLRSDLVGDEELSFSYYRSWRWFISVIESPSNLINRRLHLIIAWNYIRLLFLIDGENSAFPEQIQQIDEQYMSIQNEFIRFYQFYQTQTHYLIETKLEYEFLCKKHEILSQIDLFQDQRSAKNLEKSLQFWFHHQKKLAFYFQHLKLSQASDIVILLEGR